MARNEAFNSRNPIEQHQSLHLKHATGAFSFLNPTRAHFTHAASTSPSASSDTTLPVPDADTATELQSTTEHSHAAKPTGESRADSFAFQWRSRDNRKGRHTLMVHRSDSPSASYIAPAPTNTPIAVLKGIGAMFTQYPYWDVSWLVGVMFTLGSVVWVINAFFVWLPLVQPSTEFPGEATTAGGWSAFVGATIFEIGSILLMIEAVNENRTGCFGWALEKVVEDLEGGTPTRITTKPDGCRHHHVNRKNFVGKGPSRTKKEETEPDGAADGHAGAKEADRVVTDHEVASADRRNWQWFPSWHDLTTHYLYELGFLACSFQMFGATVFWISGFTAIPQIFALLPTQAAINEGYWVPQMVGGSGFIVSRFVQRSPLTASCC